MASSLARRLGAAVIVTLALLATVIGALVAPSAPAAALGTQSVAFTGTSCTGWASLTAPANAVRASFEINGGGGAGADTNGGSGGNGGRGARVTGTFPVSPGDKVWVKIGCGGTDANNVQAQGYARGGASAAVTGGGGGAATAICRGANANCVGGEIMAIAGGGGGGGGGTGSGTTCDNQHGGGGGAAATGTHLGVTGGTVVNANGGGNGTNNGNAWANGGAGAGTGAGGGGAASYANPGSAGAGSDATPPGADRDSGWGAGGYAPNTPGSESSRAGGGGGGGYAGGGGGASAKQSCSWTGTSRVSGAGGGGGGSSWYRNTVTSVAVTNDGGASGTGGGAGGGGWAGNIVWTTNAAPNGASQTTGTATHGVPLSIALTGTDPDGDNPVTCVVQTAPTKGSLSAGDSCSRTYTAFTSAVDGDTFTYRPVDSQGRAGDLFTVTIPIVNRKPVGTAVAAPGPTFAKGSAGAITLGASDPDGHTPLTCTITDAPDKGALSTGTSCQRTYTPSPNVVGADSFTYTVTDAKGLVGDAVTVNLTVANRVPTNAPLATTVTAGAPTALALPAADLDGDTLTCSVPGPGPAKGDLAGPGCAPTYTSDVGAPNEGVGGTDSFTYTAADQNGGVSGAATVDITIVNPDLSLTKSHDGRFAEGTGTGVYALTVSNSATAAAHGTTTVTDTLPAGMRFRSANVGTSGFTCSGTPGISTTVTCTRSTPIPVSTSVGFTITVDVIAGATGPQTNQAVVTSPYELAATADDNSATDEAQVNHRPTAADQSVAASADAAVAIVLEGTDVDAEDAGTLTFAPSEPANGTLGGTGASVEYTPDAGFTGVDSFTYAVTDGGGLTSATKTVTIYVGVRPLTGRVTDDVTGAPLAGVEVRLVENAVPGASTFLGTVVTGADGRYDLAGLFPTKGAVPVGVYALRFVDPSNDHHAEWWDDAATRQTGTNTDLGALPLGVVRDAALTPAGRIMGVVRSGAAPHAPIDGLQVRLSRVGVSASAATTTGTGGAYRFELLRPGQYELWFRDTSGEWISEWSDEAAVRDQAVAITVSVGGQVTIDEQLAPVAPPPPPDSGSISGTVRSTGPGQAPVAGVQVRLYKAPYSASAATTTDQDGQYSFGRLAPGDYKVWFRDTTGGWVSNYGGEASTLDEAAALTVANDGHIRDGSLAPKTTTPVAANSGVVSGTVTEVDGVTAIAGLQVRISVVGSTGSRAVTTAADGSYAFTKLAPGQYVVWFRDTGRTWHSEYHLDAATAAAATPVTAADGQTTDVDASLSRK